MMDLHLDSYIIIGKESQTIQITLYKNEKININKRYLLSSSSQELREIIYKNMDSLIMPDIKENLSKDLKKIDNSLIVNLKNINSNIEYICLSKGGKIMKIIPSFYNNLYIRLDCLLSFNNGVELYRDIKIDEEINKIFPNNSLDIQNNIRFLLRNNNNIINYFEPKYQFCLIKTKLNNEIESKNIDNLIDSFLFPKNNLINDMIFISGKNNLIEKRLGEGESIVLLGQSLIAFEGSISFRQINNKEGYNRYVNPTNDIIIDGPGLIIFEPCERIIPIINNNKKYALIILTILIILLEVIVQFLIFNGI